MFDGDAVLRQRAIEILLVEDNPGDVELTRLAFEEARLNNPLQVVSDGEEAIAYLRREPPYERAKIPGMILLDLNLPRVDGREVLRFAKSDPELRRIPICVLTTSRQEIDVVRSYDLHANCYIVKPVTIASFIETVSRLERFWLQLVELPRLNLP